MKNFLIGFLLILIPISTCAMWHFSPIARIGALPLVLQAPLLLPQEHFLVLPMALLCFPACAALVPDTPEQEKEDHNGGNSGYTAGGGLLAGGLHGMVYAPSWKPHLLQAAVGIGLIGSSYRHNSDLLVIGKVFRDVLLCNALLHGVQSCFLHGHNRSALLSLAAGLLLFSQDDIEPTAGEYRSNDHLAVLQSNAYEDERYYISRKALTKLKREADNNKARSLPFILRPVCAIKNYFFKDSIEQKLAFNKYDIKQEYFKNAKPELPEEMREQIFGYCSGLPTGCDDDKILVNNKELCALILPYLKSPKWKIRWSDAANSYYYNVIINNRIKQIPYNQLGLLQHWHPMSTEETE